MFRFVKLLMVLVNLSIQTIVFLLFVLALNSGGSKREMSFDWPKVVPPVVLEFPNT